MATEVTNVSIVPSTSLAENLERIARDTRIFISMPYVRGITPRALVAGGRHEDSPSSSAVERCSGIFRLDDVGLPAFDHGLLYGDGVFEGVLVTGGRLFQWREHLQRLYASADRLQIKIPYTPAELTQHILELANEARGEERGRATYLRLVVTRGIGDLGINPANCAGSTVYVIASKLQLYPESFYQQGLHLALARCIRRPCAATLDPQIKSCNYLNNVLALLETCEQRSQETLMLSQEGFVAEATTDNVFLVVRSPGWEEDPFRITVSTPAAAYCLKGITRQLVLGYGRALGFRVEESATMVPADLVGETREVFLTGTGAGLIPVVLIDGQVVDNGKPGPVTRRFRRLLDEDQADPTMGLCVDASSEEIMRYLDPAPGERQAEPMSADFVRNVFKTIDSRDWDGLQRVFCENMTYERPGYDRLVGYERIKEFYRDQRVIACGTHFLEGIVVNGDTGACWGRFVGTHKNGSAIDERFADAYTFHNGKIQARKSYFFRPAV
jgi:branched-chain amino acid aminotransferase